MSIQTLNSSPKKVNAAFERLLEQARLTPGELSDHLNLKSRKNLCYSRLDFLEVGKISDYLNISFEKIVSGNYCEKTLLKKLNGDNYSIPTKYLECPNSNMFTLRHIYQLALKKGFGKYLLQHFQITEDAVHTDIPISVELLSDVLKKFQFTAPELLSCGEKNPYYLKDSDFGKKLKSSSSPEELINNWISVEKYLEENWRYEILNLNNEECLFNGLPSDKMLEHHKTLQYSSLNVSYIRLGAASMFTTFIGHKPAEVKLLKSIHRGDSYDQFYLKFIKTH